MTSSGAEVHLRLVLDTSAYSHLRRGDGRVVDTVAAADAVLVPVTVLGELEGGSLLGRRAQENRALLDEFLDEIFVAVLPTTLAVARRYGEIFAGLRRRGTPIPVNDIWIAAATLDCGGHLLTFDRDFAAVEHLPHTVLDVA
jgi:predicted nucleic acid-binding protein